MPPFQKMGAIQRPSVKGGGEAAHSPAGAAGRRGAAGALAHQAAATANAEGEARADETPLVLTLARGAKLVQLLRGAQMPVPFHTPQKAV